MSCVQSGTAECWLEGQRVCKCNIQKPSEIKQWIDKENMRTKHGCSAERNPGNCLERLIAVGKETVIWSAKSNCALIAGILYISLFQWKIMFFNLYHCFVADNCVSGILYVLQSKFMHDFFLMFTVWQRLISYLDLLKNNFFFWVVGCF